MRVLPIGMVMINLKKRIQENGYVIVGRGAEYTYDTTRERLDHALEELEKEGYSVYSMPNNPSAKIARRSMKGKPLSIL